MHAKQIYIIEMKYEGSEMSLLVKKCSHEIQTDLR